MARPRARPDRRVAPARLQRRARRDAGRPRRLARAPESVERGACGRARQADAGAAAGRAVRPRRDRRRAGRARGGGVRRLGGLLDDRASRTRRIGGQAGTSTRIENYLGFPAGVSGGELAERARCSRPRSSRPGSSCRARRWRSSRTTACTVSGSPTATEVDAARRDHRDGRALSPADPRNGSRSSRASASTTRRRSPRRRCAPATRSTSSAAATRPARRRSSSPTALATCIS